MPRVSIGTCLPEVPPPPTLPYPNPTPLQAQISQTLHTTDYDCVCIPLTNPKWQARWERLCLRPLDEETQDPKVLAERERDRERTDREADQWRAQGGLEFDEVNVTRLEDTTSLIATASEWLELDSPDEGIRFDSELVRIQSSFRSEVLLTT
jgi:protein arginine N-methyltransferase 5